MCETERLFPMRDWQTEDKTGGALEVIDGRVWQVGLSVSQHRLDLRATCPDGTERVVWVEIDGGNLVIHGYDPAHDEPINMRIGASQTTTDTDR